MMRKQGFASILTFVSVIILLIMMYGCGSNNPGGQATTSTIGNPNSVSSLSVVPPASLSVTPIVVSGTSGANLFWSSVVGASQYRIYRGTTPFVPRSTSITLINTVSSITSSYNDTGLIAGTTYYYYIASVDSSGAQSILSTGVSFVATLNAPPPPPVGATATPISVTQINISWTPVTGASGYNIYRSTISDVAITSSNKINPTPLSLTSFVDIGLTSSIRYYYRVTVIINGIETTGSSEVSAIPLSPPIGVKAAAYPLAATSRIDISWTPIYAGTTYNVYRSTVPNVAINTTNKITPIPLTVASYSSINLPANSRYYYKVTSIVGAAESDGSVEVNAATIPLPPASISAVGGNGQNTITWTPVNGAMSYNLYYSTTANPVSKANGIKIANVTSPYIHTGLTNGTKYYYAVDDTTFNGTSWNSVTVNVITGLIGGSIQGISLNLMNTITTIAGAPITYGSTDGIGSVARFNMPTKITTDGTNLYIADSDNSTIRKMVITTGEVTTLAGSIGLTGSTDGIGATAKFNKPMGITTDGTNLYVADSVNSTVRKIVIATGQVTTIAGTAGILGSVDGVGTAARFNVPFGITTDGTNLYVTDASNQTIRKIVIATGQVTTIAGTVGVWGTTDGIGTTAKFRAPFGITTDGINLYVADTSNLTIRKIVIATGQVTTIAGTAGVQGSIDGIGTAAQFSNTYDISTDGTNLYVTDSPNHTIRKIVIETGQVTTLVGAAGIWVGGNIVDGTGSAARLSFPQGITTDGHSLFITDCASVIRKIQ